MKKQVLEICKQRANFLFLTQNFSVHHCVLRSDVCLQHLRVSVWVSSSSNLTDYFSLAKGWQIFGQRPRKVCLYFQFIPRQKWQQPQFVGRFTTARSCFVTVFPLDIVGVHFSVRYHQEATASLLCRDWNGLLKHNCEYTQDAFVTLLSKRWMYFRTMFASLASEHQVLPGLLVTLSCIW